jgi:hypothetical protein
MNNYRLRLMVATAIISISLTVVALQLAGLLKPVSARQAIFLVAGSPDEGATLSPLRIDCNHQIARLRRAEDATANLVLTDSAQRLVSCLPPADR